MLPSINEPLVHADVLVLGQRIALNQAQARGLRFRKVNPKEAFTLVDNDGRFFRASLTELTEDGGEALVYEAMAGSTESPARITLICAVLARQRMLTVVQKATELGVVRVIPVISQRSVQREGLAHEKAHAWPGQALRASRQCRRASIPEIRAAVSLAAALEDASFATAGARFYLDHRTGGGGTAAPPETTPIDIAFAVGPEGGFTEDECALLANHGAVPLRFGGRVLRSETAVLVGIAHLQQTYGDFRT